MELTRIAFDDLIFYAVIGYVALMFWIFGRELAHWERQRKAVKGEQSNSNLE